MLAQAAFVWRSATRSLDLRMHRFPRRSWPAVVAIASVYAFVSFAAVQIVYDWELDRKGLHAHGFQPLQVVRNTFEIHLVGFLVWLSFAVATAFAIQRFQRQLADALDSTRRRAGDLALISDVGAAMSVPLPQDRLAAEFLSRVQWVNGSNDHVMVLAFDDQGDQLRMVAYSGPLADSPAIDLRVTEAPGTAALVQRGAFVSTDPNSPSREVWVSELTELMPWTAQASTISLMPLVSRDRRAGAVVLATSSAGALPGERLEVLQSLARYLAGAIDGAVLLEAAEARADREQEINEELLRLDKAKNDFVSMVAHEFRTPLTGIQGFSEIIRDYDISPAEIREYANDINADARRLARMINAQLDLDRLNSGKLELRRESIDLNHLVRDLVEYLAAISPENPLTISLEPDLPFVYGDRDRLIQVVSNLVNNAVKFSPPGSTVDVFTRRDDGGLRLTVQDRGVGIPAADIERIFQPYTRIETPDLGSVSGTGLGLPIVRLIVELHGGTVEVESDIGRGSQFHVTLPSAAPESQHGDDRDLRGRPDHTEAVPRHAAEHAA